MPSPRLRPKGRRAGRAPDFEEMGGMDRFWVAHPSRSSQLEHKLECGLTIRQWLESEPGRELVRRYPHLARWADPDHLLPDDDADVHWASHEALEAVCRALSKAEE